MVIQRLSKTVSLLPNINNFIWRLTMSKLFICEKPSQAVAFQCHCKEADTPHG